MTPDGISKVARSLLPTVEISGDIFEPTAMAAAADCQLLRVIADPTPVVEFVKDPEGEFEAWWHNSGRWMDPDYKGGCSLAYRIAKAAYIEAAKEMTRMQGELNRYREFEARLKSKAWGDAAMNDVGG